MGCILRDELHLFLDESDVYRLQIESFPGELDFSRAERFKLLLHLDEALCDMGIDLAHAQLADFGA